MENHLSQKEISNVYIHFQNWKKLSFSFDLINNLKMGQWKYSNEFDRFTDWGQETCFLFHLKIDFNLQTFLIMNHFDLLISCLENWSMAKLNFELSFELSKFHHRGTAKQVNFDKFIYSWHHSDCCLCFFNCQFLVNPITSLCFREIIH